MTMKHSMVTLIVVLVFILGACDTKSEEEKVPANTAKLGATVFEKCIVCHGADGKMPALGVSNAITGMKETILLHKINAYKEGSLDQYGRGDDMHQEVQYLSDDEIKAVAKYIAAFN